MTLTPVPLRSERTTLMPLVPGAPDGRQRLLQLLTAMAADLLARVMVDR